MDVEICVLALSVIAAFYAIRKNTIISRRRATIDLVWNQNANLILKDADEIVNELIKEKDYIKYFNPIYSKSKKRKALLIVLNNYESIASGLRKGVFDLELYKTMRYSIVCRDWGIFGPTIYHFRNQQNNHTLYQEFEWLALNFERKPLKKKKY
jgi:hypothetical protein